MKKLITILVSLVYMSTNSAFAFSELYYLKNVKVAEIAPTVITTFENQSFELKKENPYYGISKLTGDSAVVILQQSGDNMFYYYQSDNYKKINNVILKHIKAANIICEQSQNAQIIGIYDKLANDVITTSLENRYTFEDTPAAVSYEPKVEKKNTTLSGAIIQVGKGSTFGVYLQNPINTATASVGDEVIGVLTSDWVYNGSVIARQGSLVYGSLTIARHAQYASRNGRVVIEFNRIITPEGKTYNISADKIDFTVSNDGHVKESVQKAVAVAAAGAVAGLLIAMLCGSDHPGRSAAIGAGVGAGGALISTAAEMGVDAEIPSFTELEVSLTKPLTVSVSY